MRSNFDDALFHFAVSLAYQEWRLAQAPPVPRVVPALGAGSPRVAPERAETSGANESLCRCAFCASYGIRHE